MIGSRRFALAAVIGSTLFAGGCAVYATPGDVGVAIVPPPVVIAPPILIRPWGWGSRGYYGGGYANRGRYFAPPAGPRGHRYYRY